MLCTRCAAAVGCWMIHHKTKATPAHVRTVLRLTAAASLEAQIFYFASDSFYLSQNPTGIEIPACRSVRRRGSTLGCSMPGSSRGYACLSTETMPPGGQLPGFGGFTLLDLTTFPRAVHACNMAMPEMSETDFAIIVYREDDRWDADVLPVAVTADLSGLIRALRQQPSIAGTIGLAGIDDYFFVAVRVIGSQVSVLLSDIAAAAEGYPLAEQVLEYLDIPVPDEEIDQVLQAGDLSIFADLGLDEMELAGISSDLNLELDEALESIANRLGFGPAMERALDIALGP
jgi:putative tRNA adenosine deaminase-associated protein